MLKGFVATCVLASLSWPVAACAQDGARQGSADLVRVRAALHEAHRAALAITRDIYLRNSVLHEVGKLHARTGDEAGARDTAAPITDGRLKAEVIRAIAGTGATSRPAPRKLAPDERPGDLWDLRDAVVGRVRTGDLAGALRMAADPSYDAVVKACAYMHIAVEQASLGAMNEAWKTADRLYGLFEEEHWNRQWEEQVQVMTEGARLRIALALARKGDVAGALRTADGLLAGC